MIRDLGTRVLAWLLVAAAIAVHALAAGRPMAGMLLELDPVARTMLVSCESEPGELNARVMRFVLDKQADLKGLKPGATVEFTVSVGADTFRAEDIRVRPYENLEQEPLQARRLTLLNRLADPAAASSVVAPGQKVPDFSFTDHVGKRVALSALSGKVVALTFTYIRCPNPAYCFRLANNFRQLQGRFGDRLGTDLVLLTLVLDPEHDKDGALADYAAVWGPRPGAWHFLTGSLADVKRVSRSFGAEFWQDEGFLAHSFRTVVIDRQAQLVAALEGNHFTPVQLADLVQVVLDR